MLKNSDINNPYVKFDQQIIDYLLTEQIYETPYKNIGRYFLYSKRIF